MGKIILLHFGAFVPGIQQPSKPPADETDEGDGSDPSSDSQMTDGCKGTRWSLLYCLMQKIIIDSYIIIKFYLLERKQSLYFIF